MGKGYFTFYNKINAARNWRGVFQVNATCVVFQTTAAADCRTSRVGNRDKPLHRLAVSILTVLNPTAS